MAFVPQAQRGTTVLLTMKSTVLKGIRPTPHSTPTASYKPYCKGMCGPVQESPNQPGFILLIWAKNVWYYTMEIVIHIYTTIQCSQFGEIAIS